MHLHIYNSLPCQYKAIRLSDPLNTFSCIVSCLKKKKKWSPQRKQKITKLASSKKGKKKFLKQDRNYVAYFGILIWFQHNISLFMTIKKHHYINNTISKLSVISVSHIFHVHTEQQLVSRKISYKTEIKKFQFGRTPSPFSGIKE